MSRDTYYIILLGILLGYTSITTPFMVGGWVPYWKPKAGTAVVHQHAAIFDQVSPFTYQVNKDGSIKNMFSKHASYWQDLAQLMRDNHKLLIPTITWQKTDELHAVLSNSNKRAQHINHIMNLVDRNFLAGININYENIDSADREGYISFIQTLSKRLHDKSHLLHLTLGGRTSDTTTNWLTQGSKIPSRRSKERPNMSLYPGYGEQAERYKKTIAQCADQVIVMAYNYNTIPFRKRAEAHKQNYYACQAPNEWVEQVLAHTLTFIPAYKLVLGVQTYGREFTLTTTDGIITPQMKQSIRYPSATKHAQSLGIQPKRTPGGEIGYSYTDKNGQKHYAVYIDAQSIKDKVALIRKYHLKGLYFFAIYGEEDPAIWALMKKERAQPE